MSHASNPVPSTGDLLFYKLAEIFPVIEGAEFDALVGDVSKKEPAP